VITGPSEDDLREMREVMMGVIDFEPTDDELRAVWADQELVGLAHTWSWHDTEVRDDLAAALEAARQEPGR
jgi:hypothetical protein